MGYGGQSQKRESGGERKRLGTTTILKGWKSLSPGLRGTSYPGVVSQTCPTLKGLHRSGKTPVVVLPRCTLEKGGIWPLTVRLVRFVSGRHASLFLFLL